MEEKIKNAIMEKLNNEKIELVGVNFGVEDNVKTLFVTIDSETGVDTNLCEKAMRIVSPIIDGLNLDIEEYVLDVGSKGELK